MRKSVPMLALLVCVLTLASAIAPVVPVRSGTPDARALPDDGPPIADGGPSTRAEDASMATALGLLASSFTENAGQLADDSILYHASSDGVRVGFGRGFVLFALADGVAARLTFPGSEPVAPVGQGELGHRSSFLLGPTESAWRTGVRSYSEVAYLGIHEGVDLVYRIGPAGLKYDLVVRPGADPQRVLMSYEGVEEVAIGPDGSMSVRTAAGDLSDAAPTAATADGAAVWCAFEMRGATTYGFSCGQWDRSRTLLIDPMVYATYVGGGGAEEARSVAMDTSGNAYVAGLTHSTDFPATAGAFRTYAGGGGDAFVAKLGPDGDSLVHATYIGGTGLDDAGSVRVDSSGYAYVAGRTESTDFPVTFNAYQTSSSGNSSFVVKLNPYGTALTYATYLGSGAVGPSRAVVAVDAYGYAYVAGTTNATDFTVTAGAFQLAYGGNASDAFVVKLNTLGTSIVYSTYLGGSGTDRAAAIFVDSYGRACVAGTTASADFPTSAGAFRTSFQGGETDGFVTLLASNGATLTYSTYLGGSLVDEANAVRVDAYGYAYVAGTTNSMDFPVTAGAYKTGNNGLYDGFVAKLNTAGSALTYATYIGTNDNDYAYGLDVDGVGNATVVGGTASSDLPVSDDAVQSAAAGGLDGYMAELDSSGASLVYSTYLGGSAYDIATGVALGAGDDVAVVGHTGSTDLPVTSGAAQTSYGGGTYDAFVAMVSTARPPSQYRVDFATEPSGLLVTIDGVDRTTPFWDMWDAGSHHEVSTSSPQQTGLGARAAFAEWSDGGYQTHDVVADGPKALTASFSMQYLVSFETSPWRLDVTVDAVDQSTPYTDWWGEGTSHTVSAPSPQQAGSDTQYLFESWSDDGAVTHSILVDGPLSMTATFTAQYRVTIETDPAGQGVQVDGVDRSTPYSQWWDSGATHTISATPPQASGSDTRYAFSQWSDYRAQTHDVSAYGPETYTAYYSREFLVTFVTDPAGFGVRVDGEWATAPVSLWLAESSYHSIYVNYSQEDGNYYFASWSDGGSISHSWTADGPANVTATFEMPPPTITVVNPTEGERARGGLLLSGSAGAGATIQLRVDGGDWADVTTATASGLWSYEWDSKSVANGDHTLEVKAVRQGKESSEASRDVTVWNPGPPGFLSGLGIVYAINAVVLVIAAIVLALLVLPPRQRRE